MTTKEIHSNYKQIINYLDNRELKIAFELLNNFIAGNNIYLFSDEITGLQDTYKQLLYYFSTGTKDDMRIKIYNKLLVSVYELTDKVTQKLLVNDSPELYYSIQRTHEIRPESIEKLPEVIFSAYDLNNNILAEESTVKLFRLIWTTLFLTDEEMKSLRSSLISHDISSETQKIPSYLTITNCQIVSALILALQKVFDKKKMILLIDAAESSDEEVKIRAYTGIMLTLYLYKNRIEHYSEIIHRIDSLAENPDFRRIVYHIILRFILSRETEKISNKLKDEILPEMMKLNPKFNPNISLKDISSESIENDMNPEWIEKLSDTPLGKKIEELNDLQEEGADVMHSTFIHLKSFPFFSEISNWFMPFKKEQSLLSDDKEVIKSLEFITNVGFMCNSDLYSFFLSIQQIPEEGRRMMIGQIESQLSEVKQQKMAELRTQNDNAERIIGQYVQDLYRFHKLYQRRKEFFDIFTQKLDFHNLSILQQYFSDKNDLLNIAEYYLRKNYFDDARVLFERLSDNFEGDEMLFQKIGYCLQMTGHYEKAITEYVKAELINPESKWLMRRMAQCYRAVNQTENALTYYLHYEKLKPENLSVLLSIGSCYLEMKNYTEALKYYFKVDYLDQESGKAWRPIAWCSFLAGKYDQARNYYNKISSNNPDSQDYLNAGHTEWVLQNITGALELYKKSVLSAKTDFEKFKPEFENDIPELVAAGVEEDEIPLMLDNVRYSIEAGI